MHGKEQTLVAETARIKEIYEKDVNNIGDVYATIENELIYYEKDKNGNKIPIPKGFSPITTEDQGTKETGFVIKNNTDGNEFVWIPVDNTTSYQYERAAFARDGWSGSQTLNITTKQIKSASYYYTEVMPSIGNDKTEIESVMEYGGYYIGRYEAGIKSTTVRTNSSGVTDTILIQKGKNVYNYIKYTDAKAKAEELYTQKNSNVTSRLCSSYAWDTALKFIESKYPEYSTRSEGGYNEQSNPTTTGFDTMHPCNIYDMGGNISEFTTETNNYSGYTYTIRGGWYKHSGSDEPAAYRTYINGNAYVNVGFRVSLFL